MRIVEALRVDKKSKVSLVGSGGKTSALLRLGNEWPGTVVIAATSHIGFTQIQNFPHHLIWDTEDVESDSKITNTTVITGPPDGPYKMTGVAPGLWVHLEKIAGLNQIPIFLESDGSKRRPLKAPASHEPALPDWVNHVVVVVGMSVIGKELTEENVHRSDIYSAITGLDLGGFISEQSILKMLLHPHGGLKNIPRNARKTVLLNQIDTLSDRTSLPMMEMQLLTRYDSVITASFKNNGPKNEHYDSEKEVFTAREKIAGIILAAGNSKRMGQSKALLTWKGIPFIRQSALTAITAGLTPIIIIAGNDYEKIKLAVEDLPVQVIQNADWNEGQSSSVRLGIKSMPRKIGGAVFLLVDQPQIPVSLLVREKNEHDKTLAPIILPEAGGRRANPVLFDRTTFKALLELQGDVGGRMIFSHFPIRTIPWYEESILLDVDTPEDYRRLMELP